MGIKGLDVKNLGRDKILDISDQMDAMAKIKYLEWVQKEEQVDYDTALMWCSGSERPDISLGYKMCSPAWVMGFKTNPKRYYKAFRETVYLTEDEIRIFDTEVVPLKWRQKFDEEMKRQKSDSKG